MRAALAPTRKVDASELAEVLASSGVVRDSGFFLTEKPPEVKQSAVDSDSGPPLFDGGSVPNHALVSRRSSRALARVARVLRLSRLPQIFSSIVEPLPVDVIDIHVRRSTQKPAVKLHRLPVLFSHHVLPSSLRVPVEVPDLAHHSTRVSDVNLRERALRERHETHAVFDARIRPSLFGRERRDLSAHDLPLADARLNARSFAASFSSRSAPTIAADATDVRCHRSSSLYEVEPEPRSFARRGAISQERTVARCAEN